MKASKSYVSSFVRAKTPLYTVLTRLSLTAQKRGTVDYAVVNFAKIDGTDPENWGDYANQYRSIREFLHTPRTDDEASVEAPAAATSPVPSASSAAADDDEPPF
jgi:hypothetical protein